MYTILNSFPSKLQASDLKHDMPTELTSSNTFVFKKASFFNA